MVSFFNKLKLNVYIFRLSIGLQALIHNPHIIGLRKKDFEKNQLQILRTMLVP